MKVIGIRLCFQRLKMQSIQYRNDNTFPSKAAVIKDNVKKNRYKDIVPCEKTRSTFSLGELVYSIL